MNARERTLCVLEGAPAGDRMPVDCWFTGEAMDALKQHLGEEDELALYRKAGLDRIVWIDCGYNGPMRPAEQPNQLITPWGGLLKPVQSGPAVYMEHDGFPLAEVQEPEELEDYPWWPDPAKYDFDGMVESVRKWAPYHATMGPWTSLFEIYCQLRGLENAMIDLLAAPDLVNALLDRIEKIQTQMLEEFLPRVAGELDLVFVSDDMGTQKDLMIGRDAWEEFIAPRLSRFCGLVHFHGVRVMYHSDGAIRPLIPRLIECGIDVLNPIQHVCPGMDPQGLKKDFGEALVFYGGVDTQKTLPLGTPEDVRAETSMLLQTLGAGGTGFLCASCHNVQAGTPAENVMAMIEAVHAWDPGAGARVSVR